MMEASILTILDFFGFYSIKCYSSGFNYSNVPNEKFSLQRYGYKWEYKPTRPFNWDFTILPLIIDIQIPEYSYRDSVLKIVDPQLLKPVFFKYLTTTSLVIDLIDNRSYYYQMAFSYYVSKIIKHYNVIVSRPLNFNDNIIEMFVVCKQYEESKNGGVDKDNKFTTFISYDYFLICDGYILIDDYIRGIIQKPWTKFISSYEEYKSTLQTSASRYWIEKADDVFFEMFKTNYDGFNHKMHIHEMSL